MEGRVVAEAEREASLHRGEPRLRMAARPTSALPAMNQHSAEVDGKGQHHGQVGRSDVRNQSQEFGAAGSGVSLCQSSPMNG